MKKINTIALIVILSLVFTIPAFAAVDWDKEPKNYDVKVYINSKDYEVVFPPGMGKPFIAKGRTFVPYRILSQSLGAKVDWDGGARKVTANGNNRTVELFIGNQNYKINGASKTMDVEPFILSAEGRTYIPARYLVEGLNYAIDFAQDGKVMYICSFTQGQTEEQRKAVLKELVDMEQKPVDVVVQDLGSTTGVQNVKADGYNLGLGNHPDDPTMFFNLNDENEFIRVVCTSHPEFNTCKKIGWDGEYHTINRTAWTNDYILSRDGYSPNPKSGMTVTFDIYGGYNGDENHEGVKIATIRKTLP